MAAGELGRRRARPRAMAESCQPTTLSQMERRSSTRRLAVYGPRTDAAASPSSTASPFGTGSVPGGARRARIDSSCSGPSRSLAATASRRGESWSRASPSRAAAPTRLVARTPNNATSTAAGSPIRCRPLLPRTSTVASTASRLDSAPPSRRATCDKLPGSGFRPRRRRGPPRATRRWASRRAWSTCVLGWRSLAPPPPAHPGDRRSVEDLLARIGDEPHAVVAFQHQCSRWSGRAPSGHDARGAAAGDELIHQAASDTTAPVRCSTVGGGRSSRRRRTGRPGRSACRPGRPSTTGPTGGTAQVAARCRRR